MPLRQKSNFLNRINVIWVVQSPRQKYIASRRTQITAILPAVSFPLGGAAHDRHGRWERDAMDVVAP
jgi:hypothetical protein